MNQNPEDPQDQIHFDWENQKANRINKEQNLIIISWLIINLFQFLELDYSENIFKNEISLQEDSDQVLEKIGIDLSDKN